MKKKFHFFGVSALTKCEEQAIEERSLIHSIVRAYTRFHVYIRALYDINKTKEERKIKIAQKFYFHFRFVEQCESEWNGFVSNVKCRRKVKELSSSAASC